MNAILDELARFKMRHGRAILVGAAIWFWSGIAVKAKFIPMPELPHWVTEGYFWSGVAFNAIWWGFLNPALEKRREDLKELD